MPDSARDPLLIGIDAGTTRIRAVVFTASGSVVAEGSAATPVITPQTGWAEHDPDELWNALLTALHEALQQLDNVQRVCGLAIASVGESAIPLDKQNRPAYNALAWFDERTRAQADWLEKHIGRDALFEISGLHLDAMFGICKLLWLKQQEPDAFSRTTRWLHIADYLAWRLCGEAATDYSLASRTLALDLRRFCWSRELLHDIGIAESIFQPLCASGTRLGPVTAKAARASGLPRHCVVGVGGHDHIVGALAVGAWQPGTLLDSMGTAEALLLTQQQPLFDQHLVTSGYSQGAMLVNEPRYYIVGTMTTSGACVEWFRKTIAANAQHDYLIREAGKIPAGSHGVRFFPQMRVGTPPQPGTSSRGAFIGLSPDSTVPSLYRAVLEGLAFDAAHAVSGLNKLQGIASIEQILAIGGSSRNALLMQIKASVHQQIIDVVEIDEAVSLGAAILGGLAAGIYDDIDDALKQTVPHRHQIQPDPELIHSYAPQRHAYQQLVTAISGIL